MKRQKTPFFTRDKDFYRSIVRLILIIALQNVIVCMVGLVDNIMVGGYHPEGLMSADAPLAGVAIANQFQYLLHMAIAGVAEGMMVLASQYWGAKQIDPIRKVIAIAVRFAAGLGLVFMAVASFFPEWAMGLLANDPETIAQGAAYMRIICFSYVFFCVGNVLITAHRSVENVLVGMVSSLSGVVVNVLLNYMLIYGRGGFPEMGVRGAAIATVIGRGVEFSVVLIYTFRWDQKLKMRLKSFLSTDSRLYKDYLRIATPVFLSGMSWGLAMSVQTGILGRMDAYVVAANSVAATLYQVITVVAFGAGSAAGIVTGKAVGRGDFDNLRAYVRTLQILFLCIGALTSLSLFAMRDVIVGLYQISEQAQATARQFITVLCITVVGTSYQAPCLTGIVRGGGNTKFVFYNDLIFMWGVVLPSSLIAAFVLNMAPVVVFICLKSDQILKCAVAVWQVNSFHWVRQVTNKDVMKDAQRMNPVENPE